MPAVFPSPALIGSQGPRPAEAGRFLFFGGKRFFCNDLADQPTNFMEAAFRHSGKGVNTTDDMEKIYSRYSKTVYAYLMRLCGNDELSAELTQETFYQAIRSINRFDGKSSVSTWLCSIARHLYYDALRRRKPTGPIPDDFPSDVDFTEQVVRRDQAMIAHRRLHALEEPYREVFTLKAFCDLSHTQIAEIFGKSEAWSRVTYYRARRMLQDAMKENDDEKE